MNYEKHIPKWKRRICTGIYTLRFHPCWSLAQHRRLKDFSKGTCDEEDTQDMIERLITFATHGFEAGISQPSV